MESIMSNLPDDCQGNNPNFPWNQEDEPTCLECGSDIIDNSDKYCTDIKCTKCDFTFYYDRFDDDI